MSLKLPSVLITGVAGFCGSHLAELLLASGCKVAGIDVPGVGTGHLQTILDRIDLHQVDLREIGQVRRVLAEVRPERIYHLAALTKPPVKGGFQALYEANVSGTINLLDAVRGTGLDAAVLIAGSSAQYGLAGPDPICEDHPFRPVTHYAVTKVTQDLLGHRYWAADGLRVVRTRAFNIIGPRSSPQFAGSAFARQIAEIECRKREPLIHVGNLEPQRDFVDVRDAVRAYKLALEKGEPGEAYNVCSRRARSIRSVLEGLLAHSTVCEIRICRDPARVQPADVPIQVGDYGRLQRRTGWQPEVPFEQTCRDLLDYWRERVSSQ